MASALESDGGFSSGHVVASSRHRLVTDPGPGSGHHCETVVEESGLGHSYRWLEAGCVLGPGLDHDPGHGPGHGHDPGHGPGRDPGHGPGLDHGRDPGLGLGLEVGFFLGEEIY
ncbi:hypothetical protein GQ53DRAFT_741630 [Thozetella sp. PMI_491]|nr:hypothetical protein GQ53DRAFT_741630 [Thozetella sp. PMI_491]